MTTNTILNGKDKERPLPSQDSPAPDFNDLLKRPLLDVPLPNDFTAKDEAEHLSGLWERVPQLRDYDYKAFVHAGGSGMVFRVIDKNGACWALKIVRKRVYELTDPTGQVATTLSPVPESELRALQKLSHPNVVRLKEAIGDTKGIVGLCTTYVDKPLGLDRYLQRTLAKNPDPKGKKGIHPFSPQRLDDACAFLATRFSEVVSAVKHMHSLTMFHFDIKPANILISESSHQAVLTDMGSCIHADSAGDRIRVNFTWTYAHPELTTIINNPKGISGGGLKASAEVIVNGGLGKYDLFALGKTLQEALAIIENEFRAGCHACFGFRFLHMVACLLLDGHNSPTRNDHERRKQVVEKDGRRFADDVALDYPPELFEQNKITSINELSERMERFTRQYSWNLIAPELDQWQPDHINSVINSPAPFTKRVAKVLNHPAMHRLKHALHLGWLKEVYPGAAHDRWAHSIGVFSGLTAYYNALLADPAVPTLRLLINKQDLEHAFLAAVLHDLGQTTFGHDIEEAWPGLFKHENLIAKLLDDPFFGEPTLRATIAKYWPDVNLQRVLAILRHKWPDEQSQLKPCDGVASDALNGPIDADKFDYLQRDSVACGVAYGHGLDPRRFLEALTVGTVSSGAGQCRLALAYKAKGRPAVESLLLARYQMYGAVYWHHTFRCMRAMFTHAAASCLEGVPRMVRGLRVSTDVIQELVYARVVCAKPWQECKIHGRILPRGFIEDAPSFISTEPALDLIWQLSAKPGRLLIERLGKRDLFKRTLELRVGELGQVTNYSTLKAELSPSNGVKFAQLLEKRLTDLIVNEMREGGPTRSVAEGAAKARLDEIKKAMVPQVIIDFPTRGVPGERNLPKEVGDPERKYFTAPPGVQPDHDNVFHVVRGLQERAASVRVFTSPELHELVVRYVRPSQIRQCVESVIEKIKVH